MKKVVLVLMVLVSLTKVANAQKGSTLLYGNVGFSTNSNGGDILNNNGLYKGSTGSFSFNPGIGYQISNSYTVGIEGGYNYLDNGTISKAYKAGAFVRYSQAIAGIFSAYAQLGVGYQGADQSGTKYSGIYADITPAIYADIKNGFGLNFSVGGLGYGSSKVSGSSTTGSTFGLTFGKELSIGLSKNFGGKK